MKEPLITYDVNSHIFHSYIRTGEFDPYADIIVYDGGNLEEINLEEDGEEE